MLLPAVVVVKVHHYHIYIIIGLIIGLFEEGEFGLLYDAFQMGQYRAYDKICQRFQKYCRDK